MLMVTSAPGNRDENPLVEIGKSRDDVQCLYSAGKKKKLSVTLDEMRILGSKWKLFRFHLKQLGILLDHFGIVAPGRDKNVEVRDFHLKLKTVPERAQVSNQFFQPFDKN